MSENISLFFVMQLVLGFVGWCDIMILGKSMEIMKVKRSEIKEYLNSLFEKTNYAQNIRNSKSVENITIADLDFMEVLKDLYSKIVQSYDGFVSNKDWAISDRQKYLVDGIANISKDIYGIENLQLRHMQMYDDLYWQIYDYFDDYGNQNDVICREEVDMIIDLIKEILA